MNYKDYSANWFEEKYTYPGSDLGSVWTREKTAFRLWSPTADRAELLLYSSGHRNDDLLNSIPMTAAENGTWTASVEGDLHGIYYTYRVRYNGQWTEASDPYGHASGVNGRRSMVIDMASADPPRWEEDRTPQHSLTPTDYVIYEAHIRDMTVDRSGRIRHKGKFLGLTETGTNTAMGSPTGLDHIKALGVTHIHLLPVFDFGSVDEAETGKKQYNWGYDPVCYNVPDGSYATDAYDGCCRIREMKQMVQTLHENGLSVIMDVVYNHVYQAEGFSFNRLVPGYFSREDENGRYSNGSICGNDTASERTMVRKYIVDSVNFWADEYHIDGFRFDLVGLLDTNTVNEIVRTVKEKHPHVFFYGEGWDMQTHLTKENIQLAIQRNSDMLPHFAFFNDTMRDTMRGSVFDYHAAGFLSGAAVEKHHLLECFCGRTYWTDHPDKIINYISCHDNHTLYDRIAEVYPCASHEEIGRRCRLGAAFNLLSMGIPFFQAGEELLRKKRSRTGKIIHNSYRSPDYVNAIRWNMLNEPQAAATLDYYKGLLALRKKFDLFRMSDPQEIRARISLLETGSDITAFLISGDADRIIAAFLPGEQNQLLTLPKGKWSVLVKEDTAGTEELDPVENEIMMPSLSAMVLWQPVFF